MSLSLTECLSSCLQYMLFFVIIEMIIQVTFNENKTTKKLKRQKKIGFK